jgi:thiamine-monophosphate kinase
MPPDRARSKKKFRQGGGSSGRRSSRFITEFELIRHLRQTTPDVAGLSSSILAGIGDDAAVIKPRRGHVLLITTDLLVEQVHFDFAYMSYRQVGYRAAVANLSDMAAMGASPRYALVAVALNPKTTAADVKNLYVGIREACTMAGTAVIGGDTSSSRDTLFICLTILGEAKAAQVLERSGARKGDVLYVTGTLGDSRAGWEILKARRSAPSSVGRSQGYLLKRHIRPTARLAESRILAETRFASSAIDLSDGLAGDLRHICEESSLGAVVDLRRLPLSESLVSYAHAQRRNPLDYALLGGEDYELLFTVPMKNLSRVDALIHGGQLCATPIGWMTAQQKGLRIISGSGTAESLTARSYEHRIATNGLQP